ncbi:MAG: RNA methyltransferase [Simkaniaceae bacterium]|nr:RNA methyltransferase [Simkaniaceae bacterium]
MDVNKIDSVHHPFIKHLVKLRTNRRYRYQSHTVFIEGSKVVSEFRGTILSLLLSCDRSPPAPLPVMEGIPTYLVAPHVFKKLSGVSSPGGVGAEVVMPPFVDLKGTKRIMALDGVSDPGNFGSLLRTASAFGFEGVFLGEGTVDPYNDKALRSAQGATWRLPMQRGNVEEMDSSFTVYMADLTGERLDAVCFASPSALLLGGEGEGISEAGRRTCLRSGGVSVTIPIDPETESLNVAVAGGILMYAMASQTEGHVRC